jgi:hypothetical protein
MKDIRSMLSDKNVGQWDQRIRIGAGVALAFAYLSGFSSPFILISSALLIVTGARKNCFFYSLMNFSSCPKK